MKRTAPLWLLPFGGGAVFLACIAGLAMSFVRPPAINAAAISNRAAYPQRIVSLNPCLDPIVVRIVDRRRILAISHYSHDAQASSTPLALARTFAVTSGTAEEVLALRPDLVIAGPHVALPTILALKRLGIPLKQWPVPTTLTENRHQIAELAATMGAQRQGKALNNAIDAAVTQALPTRGAAIPALIWQSSGLVPGKGTLADELLAVTGFRNRSEDYRLATWDVLPLERLVANPPRVLLSNTAHARGVDRQLSHPVLKKLGKQIRIEPFPSRLLQCAGPNVIEAVGVLARIRGEMDQRP